MDVLHSSVTSVKTLDLAPYVIVGMIGAIVVLFWLSSSSSEEQVKTRSNYAVIIASGYLMGLFFAVSYVLGNPIN